MDLKKSPFIPLCQRGITIRVEAITHSWLLASPFEKRGVRGICLLALFVFFFTALAVRRSYAQAQFYDGKIIRVIVGSSPGGGYDLWARLTARFIGKYIPGNPQVVVQNMPGGGGLVAANYVYAVSKPDGLTLGAFNPALYFDQLAGRPEVKFDWSKFTWIGSP